MVHQISSTSKLSVLSKQMHLRDLDSLLCIVSQTVVIGFANFECLCNIPYNLITWDMCVIIVYYYYCVLNIIIIMKLKLHILHRSVVVLNVIVRLVIVTTAVYYIETEF